MIHIWDVESRNNVTYSTKKNSHISLLFYLQIVFVMFDFACWFHFLRTLHWFLLTKSSVAVIGTTMKLQSGDLETIVHLFLFDFQKHIHVNRTADLYNRIEFLHLTQTRIFGLLCSCTTYILMIIFHQHFLWWCLCVFNNTAVFYSTTDFFLWIALHNV